MINFDSLNLLPSIKKAVKKKGYENPTPIQAQSIPHLLKGRDLLGIAQTGTGKTAAFSLPLITKLVESKQKVRSNQVRSLILTPTRELASQIEANIKSYSKGLNISSSVIFGGVGHRSQIQSLKKGIDILIATPGRLLDLMSDGYIKYDQLEFFILDEADRMLDMGFIHDVKKIIKKLPVKRQTLLFSATIPNSILSLANSLLNDPVKVEVSPESLTVDRIDQSLNIVAKKNKANLLKHILVNEKIQAVLVFTKTKRGANKVVEFLEKNNIASAAIHGNKSQNAREKALNSFRSGKMKVLVATDIASRGIDVDHVSHVINYNQPMEPEAYVHRIGRTARAGRDGRAISFCDETEVKLLKAVERYIKFSIPVDREQPYHIDLEKLPKVVKKVKKASQNFKRTMRKNGGKSKGTSSKKSKRSSKSTFKRKKY